MKEDSVERDYSFLKEWTEPQAYRDPPDVAFVLWIERMAEPTAEQTVTNDHFWNNLAKLAKRYLQLATTTDPDTARLAALTERFDAGLIAAEDMAVRLAAAEAERDNLVIAVTRCNDEHVLKSDLAAAERVVEAAKEHLHTGATCHLCVAIGGYEKAYSSEPTANTRTTGSGITDLNHEDVVAQDQTLPDLNFSDRGKEGE